MEVPNAKWKLPCPFKVETPCLCNEVLALRDQGGSVVYFPFTSIDPGSNPTVFSVLTCLHRFSPLGVFPIRLAHWFLSLPFTSVDPGSNPTLDHSLACVLCFQSWLDCMSFHHWGFSPSGLLSGFFPSLSPLWTLVQIPPQTGSLLVYFVFSPYLIARV